MMPKFNSARSAAVGASRMKKMKARDDMLEVEKVSITLREPLCMRNFHYFFRFYSFQEKASS